LNLGYEQAAKRIADICLPEKIRRFFREKSMKERRMKKWVVAKQIL